MKRFALGLLIALVLLSLPALVLAQDTPTPTPDEVANTFLSWLETVFLKGVGGGALVYSLTQFIKLFVPPSVPARYIQLALAVVVWLAFTLGKQFNVEQVDSLFKLLETVAPHILAFLTSIVTSGGAYLALRNQGVPVLGYSRSHSG